MYPGSESAPFLPFSCPMDHVLSPTAWAREAEPYRDAAFLEAPQRIAALAPRHRQQAGVTELRLLPRAAFDALDPAAQRGALPLGTTEHTCSETDSAATASFSPLLL